MAWYEYILVMLGIAGICALAAYIVVAILNEIQYQIEKRRYRRNRM